MFKNQDSQIHGISYAIRFAIIAYLFILPLTLISCSSTDETEEETQEPEITAEWYLENDPYFQEKPKPQEVFRILITKDHYILKQVSREKVITRKDDPNGDKDQLDLFQKFSETYDFKDWVLKGMLVVKLSKEEGNPLEHVEFVRGETPKSWQASKYFQDDVSRLQYEFPNQWKILREFHVQYEWRIEKKEGMTDEEARQRAIDFLKTQVR